MSGTPEARWECPSCGGEVRPEGGSERQPVRCRTCGRRYRHPRLPLLLALALPGLGSIAQGHRIEGIALLAFGAGAFVGTLIGIVRNLMSIVGGAEIDILAMLLEAATGTGLVILAYVLDLALVWRRRGRLTELPEP